MKDARPGDILVWKRAEQVAGKDTGHVMIFDAPPVEDGQGLYRITVIDSTESPHAKDTRAEGSTGSVAAPSGSSPTPTAAPPPTTGG